MTATQVADGQGIRTLILGNAVVDELAGLAAAQARVPEDQRYRLLLRERRARLVRLRLLRAT
eukprot:7411711-Pyramimonas_sp.AAC.1